MICAASSGSMTARWSPLSRSESSAGEARAACTFLADQPVRSVKSLTLSVGSVGEADLGVFLDLLRPLARALQAEHGFGGGADLQLKEAFVDVADLLHVQGSEREATTFAADHHVLNGAQHSEHCAVVDRWRPRRSGRRSGVGAAFEPRVTVRVEQATAVGGQPQVLVRDTGVDRARHGEQPVPRGGALPQDRAEAVLLFQLLDEVADAVGSDVQVVVARQQAAFLGEEQEHDTHHHRDDAGVEIVVGNAS